MNRAKSIGSAIGVIILVAQAICTAKGIAFDEAYWTEMASYIAAALALAWGIWRNHNFTDTAVMIQEIHEYAKETSLAEALGIDDSETVEDEEEDEEAEG